MPSLPTSSTALHHRSPSRRRGATTFMQLLASKKIEETPVGNMGGSTAGVGKETPPTGPTIAARRCRHRATSLVLPPTTAIGGRPCVMRSYCQSFPPPPSSAIYEEEKREAARRKKEIHGGNRYRPLCRSPPETGECPGWFFRTLPLMIKGEEEGVKCSPLSPLMLNSFAAAEVSKLKLTNARRLLPLLLLEAGSRERDGKQRKDTRETSVGPHRCLAPAKLLPRRSPFRKRSSPGGEGWKPPCLFAAGSAGRRGYRRGGPLPCDVEKPESLPSHALVADQESPPHPPPLPSARQLRSLLMPETGESPPWSPAALQCHPHLLPPPSLLCSATGDLAGGGGVRKPLTLSEMLLPYSSYASRGRRPAATSQTADERRYSPTGA
nr:hypothetical protein Iba_chr11aCG12520 [Ipomoea batatas]